jgi:hypothetical protein
MTKHQGTEPKKPFDSISFVIALLGLLTAAWSAYEAHTARIEARSAIEAAQRSADAAEKSNTLAARSQSSYLVPSIQRSGDKASVAVKNVSNNVALNIRYGYSLYTGPLKSVNDVSKQLADMPLRPLVLALGSSGETTVVDSLVTVNGTQDIDATFSIPVVKMDSPLGAPRIEMQTQSIKLGAAPIPSKTLVIGLVSFEDGLNVQHSATFCFPVNSALDDQECSKLNSLQLNGLGTQQTK